MIIFVGIPWVFLMRWSKYSEYCEFLKLKWSKYSEYHEFFNFLTYIFSYYNIFNLNLIKKLGIPWVFYKNLNFFKNFLLGYFVEFRRLDSQDDQKTRSTVSFLMNFTNIRLWNDQKTLNTVRNIFYFYEFSFFHL